MNERIGKIAIYGSRKEIEDAKRLLNTIPELYELSEPDARIKIQDAIDNNGVKASILYDGNRVWSRKKIVRNVKRIVKEGVLGHAGYIPVGSMLRVPEMGAGKPILSDYTYEFFSLSCGSIAHYNKAGWIAEYPTGEALRSFFLKNEYGRRVIEYLPGWKTDAIRIVEEIEKRLGISKAEG